VESEIPQLAVVLALLAQTAHLDRLTVVRVGLVAALVLITVLALVLAIKVDIVRLKGITGHLKGRVILVAAVAAQVLRQRIKMEQMARHLLILVLQ